MEGRKEGGQRQRGKNIKLGGQGVGQDVEVVGRKNKIVKIQKKIKLKKNNLSALLILK